MKVVTLVHSVRNKTRERLVLGMEEEASLQTWRRCSRWWLWRQQRVTSPFTPRRGRQALLSADTFIVCHPQHLLQWALQPPSTFTPGHAFDWWHSSALGLWHPVPLDGGAQPWYQHSPLLLTGWVRSRRWTFWLQCNRSAPPSHSTSELALSQTAETRHALLLNTV